MGLEEPGAKLVRMVYFGILRQKALWVVSGNRDGRAEKARYDILQGGVKDRYEAELTNQRRGSGSKPTCILLYRTVARIGGGIPLSVVCPLKMSKHVSCEFDKFRVDIGAYQVHVKKTDSHGPPGATRSPPGGVILTHTC